MGRVQGKRNKERERGEKQGGMWRRQERRKTIINNRRVHGGEGERRGKGSERSPVLLVLFSQVLSYAVL